MSQLVTLSPGLKSHEIDQQTFFLSLWRRRALRIEFNRSVSITLYLPHLASGYNENFLELELLIFSLLLTQWSSDSAPISLPLSELSNISHGVFTPSVFNLFSPLARFVCAGVNIVIALGPKQQYWDPLNKRVTNELLPVMLQVFLNIYFWPFWLALLDKYSEYILESGGEERGDDMQQRATGQTRTRAGCFQLGLPRLVEESRLRRRFRQRFRQRLIW